MGDSIIINHLFFEDSFNVVFLDFIELLGVLFFLEEEIVVDLFELKGIKTDVTCHLIVLRLCFHYSAL